MKRPKKHLGFSSLISSLSRHFSQLLDTRRHISKVKYLIHDVVMSGLACMYFQDPSLLEFQSRLNDAQQRNNLQTLFGVKSIPEETQLRDIIDQIPSKEFAPVFNNYFFQVQRGKYLEQYQILDGLYICSIDGTQYFHSNNIHCSNCLITKHKDGSISYSHKVLQAAIMHPYLAQVIPLMPEEIINTDGSVKQDCETNAAKRLIPQLRKDHPQLNMVIVGDGLFSKEPMVEKILENRMHYILVAKPSDHTYLMEWIHAYDQEDINELQFIDEKERTHVYRWFNNVPLNGKENSINVNYFHYQILSKDKNGAQKVNYQNSWITDIEIIRENIETLVKAGRCRWKIENECFNT